MYTQLHFKKDGKEITLDLQEIFWLTEIATMDFLKTPVLPDTKQVTELELKEKAALAALNEDVLGDNDALPMKTKDWPSFQAYVSACRAHTNEENRLKSSDLHPLIPSYRTVADTIKSQNTQRLTQLYHAYADYYGITRADMQEFINYFNDPLEYSNIMSGFDYEKKLLMIDQKISAQARPAKPISKIDKLQDLLFPAHIKGMKSLSDWLTLSLHFKNQFAQVPIKGWWIVIADRVISVRNKRVGNATDKFLYASDHGTAKEIIVNMFSACKYFRYSEENIILIQKRYSAWNACKSHAEVLRNQFLIALFTRGASTPSERGDILLEAIDDLVMLALSKQVDFVEYNTDLQISINSAKLSAEAMLQAQTLFHNTLEAFIFTAELTHEFHRTLFRPSGSKYALYEKLGNFMHPGDSNAYVMLDMLCSINIAINEGKLQPMYRPFDAYGDKFDGDSYTEFAQSLIKLQQADPQLTDAKIATQLRSLLKGELIAGGCINFLPNLTAVMFCSETARIPRLIMSNVMLIDVIENEFRVDPAANPLKWVHAFASEKRISHNRVMTHKEATDKNIVLTNAYGVEVPLINFDGFYSQAHHDSSTDKTNVNGQLSSTRQKETMIVLQWLLMMLKGPLQEKGISLRASQETLPNNTKKSCSISELCQPLPTAGSSSKPSTLTKRAIIQEFILPIMKKRLGSLDNPVAWNAVAPTQGHKINV